MTGLGNAGFFGKLDFVAAYFNTAACNAAYPGTAIFQALEIESE